MSMKVDFRLIQMIDKFVDQIERYSHYQREHSILAVDKISWGCFAIFFSSAFRVYSCIKKDWDYL